MQGWKLGISVAMTVYFKQSYHCHSEALKEKRHRMLFILQCLRSSCLRWTQQPQGKASITCLH